MAELRVWAPGASSLEVEIDGARHRMRSEAGGWWSYGHPSVAHGVDYAFLVDGAGPFPDPRSPWQPQGVHGPSRHVDHGRFAWKDHGWRQPPLSSAVIYELHVGTFSPAGTFDGAIDRLDHLVDLGITHVELMPVAAFPGRHGWGYDGVALYAPHEGYGGPDGLKRLVDACHARGLAVVLDVVYNHLGPSGNYLRSFGPYFTSNYSTPWGEAVNLDGAGSDEVRRFIIENALMWLRDFHVDGLRLDAVHAIHDMSATHVLAEIADEVAALEAAVGRHLVLIAESDLNDPRVVRPRAVGGLGLDAQWNEDFHHALHALLTGERNGYYADFGDVDALRRVLTRGFAYDGRHSAYRGHKHGAPAHDLAAHRFVGCLQNHDQVGNRAIGERTSHLLPPARLRLGAALVLLSPFVPMLFQGEEWGASTPFLYFTDHAEPELADAVRRGRRREFAAFGWDPSSIPDPQDADTVRRSRLDWDERGHGDHRDLLAWHRDLIRLRRSLPALTDPRLDRVHLDEGDGWLVMRRDGVMVAANLTEAALRVPLPDVASPHVALSIPEVELVAAGAAMMPAGAVAVITGGDGRRGPDVPRGRD